VIKALDLHEALMTSLAFVSKVEEPTSVEDRVEKELVQQQVKADKEKILQPSKNSFLFDE